jgi:multidrug efflux pump
MDAPLEVTWHAMLVDEVVNRLATSTENGLDATEATARLKKYGPLLGVWLLKKPEVVSNEQQNVLLRIFRVILLGAIRKRWLTIALTLAFFVAALLALPYVPRQFFPASDRPELVVDMTLPQNASIFASDGVAAKLDALLAGDPDVASWSTYVGRGAVRFYLPLNVQLANDFFVQAVVIAKNVAARDRLHTRLEKMLAEQLPSVVARVSPLELGPPVGWPVQYRVSGPDMAQVRAIALQLGQAIGSDPNLRLINFDWMEPSRKVRIKIDQDQARLVGLSSQALAEVLNTVMAGTPVTQVRDNIYLINVITRAQDEQRVSNVGCRHSRYPFAVPANHVDSHFDGFRLHSDRSDCVLGADGFCHHGRAVCSYNADVNRYARSLRC